jgi:hypothetical protein
MSRRSLVKRVSVAVALVVPLSVGTVLAASPAQASAFWTINGATHYSYNAAAAELPYLETECYRAGGDVVDERVEKLVAGYGFEYWGEVSCRSARSVG